jgi:hypothetical protein
MVMRHAGYAKLGEDFRIECHAHGLGTARIAGFHQQLEKQPRRSDVADLEQLVTAGQKLFGLSVSQRAEPWPRRRKILFRKLGTSCSGL